MKPKTLDIYLGPMKSEKTLEAARNANRWGIFGKAVFLNPQIDARSRNGLANSRSGIKSKCLVIEKLEDAETMQEFIDASLVVIDEAQFFVDLVEHVRKHRKEKSYIVVSLDGDYKQEKFGNVWDLIPICDNITKLKALCQICKDGTEAICTIATKPMNGQVRIAEADGDEYLSVCINHADINEKEK